MTKISKLHIISAEYIDEYKAKNQIDIVHLFKSLEKIEVDFPKFDFYTSLASVYSSKIEGEDIDIDSYIKHKFMKRKYLPNYTKKTDDLFNAYKFANVNKLNFKNFLAVHKIISKHLIPVSERGVLRTLPELVIDSEERIVYVATDPKLVKSEINKLFKDIAYLIKKKLTYEDVFYFASMIHLVFVKIHPFYDGNGRSARLLGKWFIAEKLGKIAWYLKSEKYYYQNINQYYKNEQIGIEYEDTDYSKSLPFLLMLPKSLNQK